MIWHHWLEINLGVVYVTTQNMINTAIKFSTFKASDNYIQVHFSNLDYNFPHKKNNPSILASLCNVCQNPNYP